MDERAGSVESVTEKIGYPIPVSRARWSLALALLTLAIVVTTLAMLLSGNPTERPLWLLLLLTVVGAFSAVVAYVLVKALRTLRLQQPQ